MLHACHFISASSLLLLFAENQIMQRQTTIEKEQTHLKSGAIIKLFVQVSSSHENS